VRARVCVCVRGRGVGGWGEVGAVPFPLINQLSVWNTADRIILKTSKISLSFNSPPHPSFTPFPPPNYDPPLLMTNLKSSLNVRLTNEQ
jgi:hypothetical protein